MDAVGVDRDLQVAATDGRVSERASAVRHDGSGDCVRRQALHRARQAGWTEPRFVSNYHAVAERMADESLA